MHEDSCNSNVGMLPWNDSQPQILNLSNDCFYYGIQHEFLHAVGVYHTHSRTDRDKHVTIHWDNIPEDVYEDFCKESSSLNFKTKYEPRSLMHYVWNAGAINDSEPTISLKVICQYKQSTLAAYGYCYMSYSYTHCRIPISCPKKNLVQAKSSLLLISNLFKECTNVVGI